MPDIRKALNVVQQNVADGKLKKIDPKDIITIERQVCGLLAQVCDDLGTDRKDTTLNQNIPKIMELVNTDPDYLSMYQSLFDNDKLPLWCKIKINQFMNQHPSCAIPSAHFLAMIYDIIYAGLKFFKTVK